MGSVSISSCRYMCVSYMHLAAVLNDAFCMTCSLLMLGRMQDRPNERGILQSRSHDCLVGSHEGLLLFTPIVLL